jgi:hypothetical protein
VGSGWPLTVAVRRSYVQGVKDRKLKRWGVTEGRRVYESRGQKGLRFKEVGVKGDNDESEVDLGSSVGSGWLLTELLDDPIFRGLRIGVKEMGD